MIKTHKELADFIAGRSVLHMNSLGKESTLCLEWLSRYAAPSRVVSVFYRFLAAHPGDDPYLNYLRRRYPQVEFVVRPNTIELNQIQYGVYQSPLAVNYDLNGWDYTDFDRRLQTSEVKAEFNLDYVCSGFAKYESFARASRFYKEGLVTGDRIYPLGMMTKAEVYGLIRDTGLKLHPCYKFSKSTFDHPSYWKMRANIIASPEYRRSLYKWFPLMRLDEYRYEVLFGNKIRKP